METPTRRRIYRESGTGAAQKRKEKEDMAVVFHRRRRQEYGRRPLLCDDRGRKMAFRFWVKARDNSRRHYLASVLLIGALQRMEERLHQRASRCPDAPPSLNPPPTPRLPRSRTTFRTIDAQQRLSVVIRQILGSLFLVRPSFVDFSPPLMDVDGEAGAGIVLKTSTGSSEVLASLWRAELWQEM